MSTEQPESSRPAFSLRHPTSIGLAVALVLALVLAGLTTLRWRQADDETALRNEVIAAGKTLVLNIRNISYRTLEEDFARAVDSQTGANRKAYEQATKIPEVVNLIRDLQRSTKVAVAKIGLVSVSDDQAELLVYGTETRTDKELAEPVTVPLWLRVELERDDGKWLVSDMEQAK